MNHSGRVTALGRVFFAIAMLGFGVQQFGSTGYLAGLELVPRGVPAHTFWVYLTGAVLVVAGLCIMLARKVRRSALVLGACFFLFAIVRRTPEIGASMQDLAKRTVLFETLTLSAGALLLAYLAPPDPISSLNKLADRMASPARYLFAISMLIFGIDHFPIAGYIASLIPAWMPWRLFLAYFTGAAFVASAFAIAFRKKLRVTGMLLGLMLLLWVALLHAPRIAGALQNPSEWNSGFVALAVGGCALVVASLPERGTPESESALMEDEGRTRAVLE